MINGPIWCALSSRTRCPPPRTMCSVARGISVAMKQAPRTLGSARFRPLGPAPGTYVFQR